MGSKIGTILSLVFVAMFFVLGIDLMLVQYTFSELDAISVNVSYAISRQGYIDQTLITNIESKYNVSFICEDDWTPAFGETVRYELIQQYKPIILAKNILDLKIVRYAIIGFYG